MKRFSTFVLMRGVIFAIITLGVGWFSAQDALVRSMARRSPDTSLNFHPYNPIALAQKFARQSETTSPAALEKQLPVWDLRARSALKDAPLNAAMLRIIGTTPGYSNTGRLLALAEQVSRRDSLLQLAMIEAAVERNDIPTALVHYDRALSIYPDLRPLLFPVLTGAMTDPDIRKGFIALAGQGRPWVSPFLAYAVRQGDTPSAIVIVLEALDRMPDQVPDIHEHQAALIARLLGEGDYVRAHSLAQRAAAGDAARIDRIDFTPDTWATPVRPLSWATTETDGINAQLENDNQVLVSVSPAVTGLAIFRILLRPPGHYRFTATAAPGDDTNAASGRWTLLCLRPGNAPTRSMGEYPVDAKRTITLSKDITVPVGCAAMRVDFTVDNSRGSTDGAILLRDIALKPLR